MLIIGTIIGAGFCSGKEIVTYFAKYGFSSLFFVPMLLVLYYFIFKLFLSFGLQENCNSINEINKKVFGKATNILNFLLFFIYLIFTSAMFAGIFHIGQNFNNYFGYFLLLFSFILSYILLLKPFSILKKINSILIPILIVLMLVLCVFGIFNGSSVNFNIQLNNSFLMFFNPIIYACQGLAIAYYILVKAGENLTKKQVKNSSFFVALTLCFVQSLIIVVVNINPTLLNSAMPMLSLAFAMGFPFDALYFVLLYIAILTTLLSTSRSLFSLVALKIKNSKVCAFVVLLLALILSFFGFDKIVNYFYPIIGMIGCYVVCKFVFHLFFENRFKFVDSKIHKRGKDT